MHDVIAMVTCQRCIDRSSCRACRYAVVHNSNYDAVTAGIIISSFDEWIKCCAGMNLCE